MKEAHLAEIIILDLAVSSTLMSRLENMHCKLSEYLLTIGYTGSFASPAMSTYQCPIVEDSIISVLGF
jgi:hypothetical protein